MLQLILHGVQLDSVSADQGILNFITWLKQFTQPLLIGHNIRSFDTRVLQNTLTKTDMVGEMEDVVYGFVDSLPMFRSVFGKDRKCFSQESLVKDVLGATYEAHNAIEDVTYLQKVVKKMSFAIECFQANSFTMVYVKNRAEYNANKALNLRTFFPVITAKLMSENMAAKAAGSGLKLSHLGLAFQRGETEGLAQLLKDRSSGKIRVTARQAVIQRLASYFE